MYIYSHVHTCMYIQCTLSVYYVYGIANMDNKWEHNIHSSNRCISIICNMGLSLCVCVCVCVCVLVSGKMTFSYLSLHREDLTLFEYLSQNHDVRIIYVI